MEQYQILMRGAQLRQVDLDYRNHLQAYLNFAVQAKKKAGKGKEKPVYSRFTKFYNYNAEIDRAMGKRETSSRFSRLSRHLAERREAHGG